MEAEEEKAQPIIPGTAYDLQPKESDPQNFKFTWRAPTPFVAQMWLNDHRELKDRQERAKAGLNKALEQIRTGPYDPVLRATALEEAAKLSELSIDCDLGQLAVFFQGLEPRPEAWSEGHPDILAAASAVRAELREKHGVTDGTLMQVGVQLFAMTSSIVVQSTINRVGVLRKLDFGIAPQESGSSS